MFLIALVLGVVEGITEFLPVSSTGHLIVVSSMMGFTGKRAEVFQVFIQLGAVLAVVWEYRERLLGIVRSLPDNREARFFASNLLLAFLPIAVVGLLVHDFISTYLFVPLTVSAALLFGAALIMFVEALHLRARTHRSEDVSRRQAVMIGLAQCLALWPGFSRSAATILGGVWVGLDRRTATEFSFFLAVPTMLAATVFDLAKNLPYLTLHDLLWLAVSFVVSFVVAWASIRWLLRYVSSHSFRIFAVYRVIVGGIVGIYMT